MQLMYHYAWHGWERDTLHGMQSSRAIQTCLDDSPAPSASSALSSGSAVMMTCRVQIQGLPTMVFVGVDPSKPALRTEGLLPAASIKEIIETELLPQAQAAE